MKIKIYTGNLKRKTFFEDGLHPKYQIEKVKKFLKTKKDLIKIHTNSPFVAEAFNKFGKEKGYNIEFYFNNKKVSADIVFDEFSKPFEQLIFGDVSCKLNYTRNYEKEESNILLSRKDKKDLEKIKNKLNLPKIAEKIRC